MNVEQIEKCCGCGLCKYKCPKNAISYLTNDSGFIIPKINKNLCIDCEICYKNCTQIILLNNERKFEQKYYAFQTCDIDLYKKSSSGGLFGSIANIYLEKNGVVYGCSISNNNSLVLKRIDKKEFLDSLFGSKYGQSYENNIFPQVKSDLENGKKVLVCALPCQINGLKSYLGKSYENLLLMDFVCHGVPSFEFFKTYFNYLEKSKQIKIQSINFRAKKAIPWGYELKVEYRDGKKTKSFLKPYFFDAYFASFAEGKNLNKSCYDCRFSTFDRIADLTIGDFWKISKSIANQFPNPAISMVMVNSEKGDSILSLLKENGHFVIESDKKAIEVANPELISKSVKSQNDNNFYKGFKENAFMFIKKIPKNINIMALFKYQIKKYIRK